MLNRIAKRDVKAAATAFKGRRDCLRAVLAAALAAASSAHVVISEAAAPAGPRVVVLSWDLTEMLLSLGVTPVGIAAPAWYVSGVVAPPLPTGVVNVGLLFQPNYDLLYELKPDLILVTPAHASVRASFERIAPTLTLGAYMTDPAPYPAMQRELSILAGRLDLHARAQSLLAQTADVIARARQRLNAGAPSGGYPEIYLAQALDARHLRIFGQGSMFDELLHILGLRNAAAESDTHDALITSRSGNGIVELDRLAAAPKARLLWIGPGAPGTIAGLYRNAVWQQLPFSHPGQTATLPVISPTGALISVQRFAEAVANAMQSFHVV